MFSVDNFYEVFNSYYCWPEKNNALNLFVPHGSRNWDDVKPWGVGTDKINGTTNFNSKELFIKGGAFIMHDQEPITLDSLECYNYTTQEEYPEFIKMDPDAINKFQNRNKVLSLVTPIEFIQLRIKTTSFPIICHSEKNSKDIDKLQEANIITCYYWWHGFIARDWFRHWRFHNSLKIKNKANEKFRFLVYSREFTGTRKYRKKVIEHLKKHQPLVNYNWHKEDRSPTLSAHIDTSDANSAIHIVAETLFETEKIYLTEKVFKPMVMSQPFILIAPPGSLQYLRDYGFKTFNNFWDEAYDLETDHNLRLKKIFKLIDQLSALSQEDFFKLYNNVLPIIEYNRQHFYSDAFQSILWNELEKNCETALSEQKKILEQYPQGSWIKAIGEFYKKNGFILPHWKDEINLLINENPLLDQRVSEMQPNLYKLLKQNQSHKHSLDHKPNADGNDV